MLTSNKFNLNVNYILMKHLFWERKVHLLKMGKKQSSLKTKNPEKKSIHFNENVIRSEPGLYTNSVVTH